MCLPAARQNCSAFASTANDRSSSRSSPIRQNTTFTMADDLYIPIAEDTEFGHGTSYIIKGGVIRPYFVQREHLIWRDNGEDECKIRRCTYIRTTGTTLDIMHI